MLPTIEPSPNSLNELPRYIPRPTENRLHPLSAKVIVEDNQLFVELFNKKRLAIQSTTSQNSKFEADCGISIKVFQRPKTELLCFINRQEFSKSLGVDSKKVSLLLKREQLGLYLECMREFSDTSVAQLDKHLNNKIARKIKNETQGLIKKKDFCFIQNECQLYDHQKQWSLHLIQAKKINDKIKYIVLSIMTPRGKRFKIEYRDNNNFHLRLKKNTKGGSSNLISLHVDLYSGQLIAKNKILLYEGNPYVTRRRPHTPAAFIEMANIAMCLNRISGVIPYLKAHEFSANGYKGYFFTAYCPEGDLFDNIVCETIPVNSIFRMLRDLCLTVDEIHQHGFIHRDIKPENILIKKVDEVFKIFVADLEFAEARDSDVIVKKGTLSYIDPELVACIQQNKNKDKSRPEVDSYALGVVAYASIFKTEVPWAQNLVDKQLSTALKEMKAISDNSEILQLDKRLSKAILGLLTFDSTKRMPLKEAAELFDDLYRNPPSINH